MKTARNTILFSIPILLALSILFFILLDIPSWFIILFVSSLVGVSVLVAVIVVVAWYKLGLR